MLNASCPNNRSPFFHATADRIFRFESLSKRTSRGHAGLDEGRFYEVGAIVYRQHGGRNGCGREKEDGEEREDCQSSAKHIHGEKFCSET